MIIVLVIVTISEEHATTLRIVQIAIIAIQISVTTAMSSDSL